MWDFSQYCLEDLQSILEHCEALEKLGIEQNEDMMRELRAEIEEITEGC